MGSGLRGCRPFAMVVSGVSIRDPAFLEGRMVPKRGSCSFVNQSRPNFGRRGGQPRGSAGPRPGAPKVSMRRLRKMVARNSARLQPITAL